MTSPSEALRVCLVLDDGRIESAAKAVWQRIAARLEICKTKDLESMIASSGDADLLVLRATDAAALEMIERIHSLAPRALVAVWSPSPTVRGAVAVVRHGAIDYLPAVIAVEGVESLARRVRGILAGERRVTADEGDDDWEGLLGESPAIQRLEREVETVAAHDATVLVEGETGTGKERVARLLHRLSPRAPKPFLVCDCSAIVPTLAESELFGHEKGAFTGARRMHAGLFEAARGGTLLFDQIQELPFALQPKLLRVLENREFSRLGSTRTIAADVRVIAATNRSLREEVKEKRFREDLYYRLNTATLAIPPLRERREDIPILVAHFLRHFSKRFGKPNRLIARDALNRLVRHPWEGNVRELRNVIERAVAIARRPVITFRELRLAAPAERKPAPSPALAAAELVSLDELERAQIRRVLEMTGGNRERAARALGLSRSTLYRRLSELGLHN